MLIYELVFKQKVEMENIVGSVKIILGKSLPQLAWLFLKWLVSIIPVASVKFLPRLAWLLLKWLVDISHVASVIIVLIHESVFNVKVESENIVGSVKIILGKSLPQLARLILKCLSEISHFDSVKSLHQLDYFFFFKMTYRDKSCCFG